MYIDGASGFRIHLWRWIGESMQFQVCIGNNFSPDWNPCINVAIMNGWVNDKVLSREVRLGEEP